VPEPGILLKYLHILAAMVFVTGYIGGTVLQLAAAGSTDWTLRNFAMRWSNVFTSRILVPGSLAAGVLGVATALALNYPLFSGWVLYALILYFVTMAIGIAYWNPLGRKQTAAAEARDEARFTALAAQPSIRIVGAVDTLIVLALIYLMVVKPA
jgi:uncharacterized membrane protein